MKIIHLLQAFKTIMMNKCFQNLKHIERWNFSQLKRTMADGWEREKNIFIFTNG